MFKFSNNASATLASSITSVATSITLTTGNGALFPALSGTDYFNATLIDSSNNIEIIKVTARSGDVLTVVRGQDNTTARAYNAGDKIELRLTAAVLSNFVQLDGAQTFTGTLTSSGGTLAGTWAGTPTFSGAVSFTGSPSFTTGTPSFGNGASLAGTFSGTPTFSGAVTFSGSPVFSSSPVLNNNITFNTKDSGGTLRSLIGIGSDNYVNIYNAGNAAVRILNQAGSASLATLSDASGNFFYTGYMTGGGIPLARLTSSGTTALAGTASASTFLRGDGTWAAPAVVSSFIGQTGAVDPSVLGAIGSVMTVHVLSTSAYSPNATIAGSSLFYPNTQSYIAASGSYWVWYADSSNNVEITAANGRNWSLYTRCHYTRYNAGNLGVAVPPNCTALSGTWRILSIIPAGTYYYDSGYRSYDASWYTALAVRIA